jgi:hypothetical protein
VRIRITEYCDELRDALRAFNARLEAGGSSARFPPPPDARSAPPTFHQGLKQARYLAVEESLAGAPAVRGAYALKFQTFWLEGDVVPVADFALPVSEGIVNRTYAHIAVQMLRDALHRQPLLYGLGMGGMEQAVARLLKAAGWRMSPVPFFFNVVHPVRFLRNIVHLRKRAIGRTALDLLAFSGAGWVALVGWNLLHARPSTADRTVRAETVSDFDDWSDEIWAAARSHYGMCSVRDAVTLRKMYPRETPGFQRVKVLRDGRPIGWALLMNTQLNRHNYFGNARLGSIIDCLAEPKHASTVIRQARAVLVRQGGDLIISNQSHRAWCKALRDCGFISGPSNFILTTSRELTCKMEEKHVHSSDVHLNRGDGDGPINL